MAVEYMVCPAYAMPMVIALWQDVFHDRRGWVESSIRHFVGRRNVYVAMEDGRVLAQLMAVPCHLGAYKGAYLYALATALEARGRGVMSGLMAYAQEKAYEQGAQFACLIPADEGLFGFYKARGYSGVVSLRMLRWASHSNAQSVTTPLFGIDDLQEFLHLRENYLPFALGFDGRRSGEILADIQAGGLHLRRTGSAYAVYKGQAGQLLVPELGAVDDAAADVLLAALCNKAGVENALLTLPVKDGAFAGKGCEVPYALYTALQPGFILETPYLRFGFDETLRPFESFVDGIPLS